MMKTVTNVKQNQFFYSWKGLPHQLQIKKIEVLFSGNCIESF